MWSSYFQTFYSDLLVKYLTKLAKWLNFEMHLIVESTVLFLLIINYYVECFEDVITALCIIIVDGEVTAK